MVIAVDLSSQVRKKQYAQFLENYTFVGMISLRCDITGIIAAMKSAYIGGTYIICVFFC